MAVRALILLLCGGLLLAPGSSACFGPKLYVGLAGGVEAEVMYALTTLYIKEKTGVESLRVDLAADVDPLHELVANRLDLALAAAVGDRPDRVLAHPGYPVLVSGVRPREDLQFTTVLPALARLDRLLATEDLDELVRRVNAGESAMAAVRRLLMERRWI
ncbi:MAG: hypothetical protein RQ723_04915 [Desulfuromonadales bacterium]|nr:hypothetical protein [Desulfuromonadales bacterium]